MHIEGYDPDNPLWINITLITVGSICWVFTLGFANINTSLEQVDLIITIVLKFVSIISFLGVAFLNWRKIFKKIGLIKHKDHADK